jgi:hypothetical protein
MTLIDLLLSKDGFSTVIYWSPAWQLVEVMVERHKDHHFHPLHPHHTHQ